MFQKGLIKHFLCLLLITGSHGFTMMMSIKSQTKDILYDVPVSNHGARIRLISRLKTIDLDIRPPSELGGLKSPEYAKLSIQGKMPLLVTPDGFTIIESDAIARYLLDKYKDLPPYFSSQHIYERSLSDQITRVHDHYITPIQGCMYKAKGFVFGQYGTNRKAALNELKRQLIGIENMLSSIDDLSPEGKDRKYLCGNEITLADVTLFPTIIFCVFMLPYAFQWKLDDFLGPRLQKWYSHMSTEVPESVVIKEQILKDLEVWKSNGRFEPIMKEMTESVNEV